MTKISKKQLQDWLDATLDVKKLKKNSHVEKSEFFYTEEMHFDNKKYESEVSYIATMMQDDNKVLKSDFKTKHAAHSQDDIKSFRKSVDKRLQMKLKNGQIPHQARIDLHGMLVKQAQERLVYFIKTSQQMGLKCVLVVHGKGANSETNIGQIKQQIPYWLENLDCVLSFTSALPKDGGTGAMYVLLRKTEKQR